MTAPKCGYVRCLIGGTAYVRGADQETSQASFVPQSPARSPVAAISVIAACAIVAAFVSAVLILGPFKQSRVAPLSAAGETVIAHDVDLEPAAGRPRTA